MSNLNKAKYIKKMVADYYLVDVDNKLRHRQVVRARQMGMLLCRNFTNLSYPQIGGLFNKHHSTVIHGIALMQKLILTQLMGDYISLCRRFEDRFKGSICRMH